MTMSDTPQPRTRIQERNRALILEAGLDVFAANGFRGATLDQIAQSAGLSMPHVLYYFGSTAAIYPDLLSSLLETWLGPLRDLDPEGDPMEEILRFVRRKLAMSRDMPRESRLFAGEVLSGAPVIGATLSTDLRRTVDEKAAVIHGWVEAGRIAPVEAHHLIFSVWALTQHYADFEVQVRAVLGPDRDHWAEAEHHLVTQFERVLTA